MGSPYATDLLYDDLFNQLQAEHSNIRYSVAISREARSGACAGSAGEIV